MTLGLLNIMCMYLPGAFWHLVYSWMFPENYFSRERTLRLIL